MTSSRIVVTEVSFLRCRQFWAYNSGVPFPQHRSSTLKLGGRIALVNILCVNPIVSPTPARFQHVKPSPGHPVRSCIPTGYHPAPRIAAIHSGWSLSHPGQRNPPPLKVGQLMTSQSELLSSKDEIYVFNGEWMRT